MTDVIPFGSRREEPSGRALSDLRELERLLREMEARGIPIGDLCLYLAGFDWVEEQATANELGKRQ